MSPRSRNRKIPKGAIYRPWGPPTKKDPSPLWRHRRAFVPIGVIVWAWLGAVVVGGAGARVLMVAAVAFVVLFAVAVNRGRDWLPGAVLAAWFGIIAMTGFGGLGRVSLAAGWAVWACYWWMRDRARAASSVTKVWNEYVAGAPSKDGRPAMGAFALPGSRLINEAPAPRGGRRATIVMPRGSGTTAQAIAAIPKVASAFERPLSSISIEVDPSGVNNRATLLILPRPATDEVNRYKKPSLDLTTGISNVGVYVDGDIELYRWQKPESGAVGELIAGTTDAGKSRFLDLLLAESRHGGQGLICDWVCDPQMGQSLPDWMESVDWYAKGVHAGLVMLRAAYRVMLARNKILAQQRKKFFVWSTEMPLLVITLEEAPTLLDIPEARDLAEKIAKMGRKCGIKLRIVVQVPLLDQIGGSQTLRSMAVSGQAYLFRTGDRMSGNVMFPGLAVDPYLIPRLDKDGGTTAGMHYSQGMSTRTALARTLYVPDVAIWASTGTTTPLDDLSRHAAGPEYVVRHADEQWDTEPEPGREQPTEPDAGAKVMPLRMTCAQLIVRLLRDASGPMSQGQIAVQCKEQGGYEMRTVRESLQTLREQAEQITRQPDGLYVLTKGARS